MIIIAKFNGVTLNEIIPSLYLIIIEKEATVNESERIEKKNRKNETKINKKEGSCKIDEFVRREREREFLNKNKKEQKKKESKREEVLHEDEYRGINLLNVVTTLFKLISGWNFKIISVTSELRT